MGQLPSPRSYLSSLHLRRQLLTALWVVLSIGYGVAFYELVRRALRSAVQLQYALFGIGVYLLLWLAYLRHRGRFWRTFEHEFTHAIFALLSGHRVRHFRASEDDGGSIHHVGRTENNFLISLAPYFFPTLSVAPLALLFLVGPSVVPYIEFAVGMTLVYHIISTLDEAHPRQPDLREHGLVFSYAFIALMNLVCLGGLLAMIGFGAEAGWNFLVRGLEVLYPAI